jgi:cobalt-zinc-cadmium efflux system outer membrane protein
VLEVDGMRLHAFVVPWLVAVQWFVSSVARGDEPALTRARVSQLARAAPASRAANAGAEVARAAVTAAGVLSQDNPVLSGLGGVRFNPDGTRPVAATATLSWPVDLGGRSSRVEAAEADHRAAHADADHEQRTTLLAALLQHALVLRDQRHVAIAAERRAVSVRLLSSAKRHRTAGGVPQVDVALASLQEGRDLAALTTAEGTRDADLQRLIAVLGLPPGKMVTVAGALIPVGEPPPLSALLRDSDRRTDVRAALANADAARARSERERSARWPTINLLAQYERDDGANIGTIGLSVPIPILNANRTGVATSAAEVTAASARLHATRVHADGHLRELYTRYLATRRAYEALAPTAGSVAEALALSTRGYELGENDLASVLFVRREAVETQLALLEAEHAMANAKIELLLAVGRLPQ